RSAYFRCQYRSIYIFIGGNRMDKEKCIQLLLQKLREGLDQRIWDVFEDDEHVVVKNRDTPSLGFSLSVTNILSKMEKGQEKEKIQQSVTNIIEMTKASLMEKSLRGQEDQIFP